MKHVFLLIVLLLYINDLTALNKSIAVEKHHVTSQGNVISIEHDLVWLICRSNRNIITFDKFNQTYSVKTVIFAWCKPPNDSYSQILHSLNFNVTALKKLHLMHDAPVEMTKIHFRNLEIEEMDIENERPLTVKFADDFLKPLNTLTSLIVSNVVLPPLPDITKLKKVVLKNGVSLADFGGCQELEELHLIHWDVPRSFKNWLGNCSKILNMRFERISLAGLSVALQGVDSLENLTLTRCELTQIPYELLTEAKNIKHIEITYNDIPNIRFDELTWLESLTKLETLNFSHNKLVTGFFLFWAADFRVSNNLYSISIAHNPLVQDCIDKENGKDFYGYTKLKMSRLYLASSGLTELCFKPLTFDGLVYLDITDNAISVLQFDQLPISNTHYIADLRRNPLKTIAFGQKGYEKVTKENESTKRNVTVYMDSLLNCDCQYGWFARALREGVLSVEGANCEDQKEITQKPKEQLECNRTEENGCIFRESWKDGTVVATCKGAGIDLLPTGKAFKEIHAADNDIDQIRLEDLPPTLQFLDLQRNSIARVDEDVTRVLFNNSRRILLRGNPILCSCNNKYFIEQLQAHHHQVMDYEYLTCAGDVLSIRKVNSDDLCSVYPLIPMITVGILLYLVMMVYIIYRMYGQDIKMFLFTHGLCLCCIREEDLDADRDYDAFISFSHKDYQYVNEELLAGLEPDYQICLHFRDWIVGEWIPAQIQTSVQMSKRTIIVLSKNYLESIWGMFEFRMAFALALKEGQNRVIMIVLDDVTGCDMAPDLRHFISNNTYLKWGDPWFWRKLKYVLPHKYDSKIHQQSSETQIDNHENKPRDASYDVAIHVNINEHVISNQLRA